MSVVPKPEPWESPEAVFYKFATEQEAIRTDLIRENNRMLQVCLAMMEQSFKDAAPKPVDEAARDKERRDYFAGQALAGAIAHSGNLPDFSGIDEAKQYYAKLAYIYADAMLAARAIEAAK